MKLEDFRGDWALVTGASSGIGAEFCRQLASAGVNLVMVARRKPLLDDLSASLTRQFGIKTLVLHIDLSDHGSASLVKAATTQASIRIRVLINNAAFGPWGSFEKTSVQTYERMLQLITATPVSLCHLYLDDLSSFPNSTVINLSSPAALQPVPYKAVYSGAKSCLHNFSLALHGEWQSRGILVQTLLPGPTATELDHIGGAYTSELGEERRPTSEIVTKSLSALHTGAPFVTTNKGTYKQRLFAGIAPHKMIIREVKRMFQAPPGR
ncbi:SDR family NAD(P)-dependent oxidoreductase [Rhodoferax antarcticus]|uniref:SDR family NAD(P)-dependent oxidoreductase n=1 Tax=Rhodoferax antarcticus TaxID=81479 RepID=UPI0022250B1C|nr:SDR family NAD(P)-dependent oxidoreductase [Rhodoferax antarcticus]MCW2313698.1 short-subunit dehydrogenase [Rhodoferax antarcticus]